MFVSSQIHTPLLKHSCFALRFASRSWLQDLKEDIAQFAVDQFKEFTAINHRVLMQQKVKSGGAD